MNLMLVCYWSVTGQNLALVQDDDPGVLVVLLLDLVFGVDARPLHLKPHRHHQVSRPKSTTYTEINSLSGQTEATNQSTNQSITPYTHTNTGHVMMNS